MNIDDYTPLDDEDFGGFEANDDDSFALEHLDEYPGDLSKFKESAISLEKSAENALKATSESDIQPNSEENRQKPKENIDEDNEQFQRGSTYRSALGEGDDTTGIPFKRSGYIDDEFDSNQISTSRDTLDTKESAESTTKPIEQVFEKVDDEWVRLLKQDVERSKERNSSKSNQTDTEQIEQTTKKKEFTSVEDLGSTEEIDLGDIDAHHPSTYRLQEQEELNVTPQPELESFPEEQTSSYSYATMAAEMASTSTPEPTVEPVVPPTPTPSIPKPIKPRKEKNRKKLVFFMVGALAIAAAGYGAFLFYPTIAAFLNPNPSVSVPLTTHEMPKVHPKVEEHLKDSVRAEVSQVIDSVESYEPPILSEVHEPKKKEETAHSASKTEKSIDIPHNRTEPTNKIPKKLESVITKTASPPKTISHNNTSASSSQTAQQIFTVQVYSSPSKDDANERLERLKSRNATNISMSEQLIRGTKWYRVRFGSFNSREEAESAAKQLGFAQCWIDRVR